MALRTVCMAVSLVTRDAKTRVPGFYPRDGTRVFWLTVRSAYCGDRPDGRVLEKPATRAGLRAWVSGCFLHRGCGCSKCGQSSAQFAASPSRAAASNENAAQECSDVAYLVGVDGVLHRILVPLHVVAQRFYSVARRDAACEWNHRVGRAVRHEDRNAAA